MFDTNKNIRAFLALLDSRWAYFLGCSPGELRDTKRHVVARPASASDKQSPWPLRDGPIALFSLDKGWVMSVPEHLADIARTLCLGKTFIELLDEGDRLSQEWFDLGADHDKDRGDHGYTTMNKLAEGQGLRGWSHYLIWYCDPESWSREPDEYVIKITEGNPDIWSQWQRWPGPMVGPEVSKYFEIADAFGYILNGKLVSAAQVEANPCEDAWEYGVDTLPEHRGKGLATQVLKTVTSFIISKGRIPWHYTDHYNRPSRRLPERLGYFRYGEGLFSHQAKEQDESK